MRTVCVAGSVLLAWIQGTEAAADTFSTDRPRAQVRLQHDLAVLRDEHKQHQQPTSTFYDVEEVGAAVGGLEFPRTHGPATLEEAITNGTVVTSKPLYIYNTTEAWNVPASVDWTGTPRVPQVIHHGKCGSCFAAAAKDALESAYYRDTGDSVSLSLQDIIDCSWMYAYHNETNAGCHGGAYQAVFDWARDEGVITDRPGHHYSGNDSVCDSHRDPVDWHPQGFVAVPGDEQLIMHALAHKGPLAISMYTAYPAFDHYPGQGQIVLPPLNCSDVTEKTLDHSMLLVGYGTTLDGIAYWKIKNNWGTAWGDMGYFYLFRDRDCGLRISVAMVV